jgi:hypothetical protein
MSTDRDTRSVPTLVGDLLNQVSMLVQTEGRLLRTEMSNKISQAENGGLAIIAGAIFLLVALMVLVQALVVALTEMGMDAGMASLLVGVVLALVGGILVMTGKSRLSPSKLAPEHTQKQLKRDARMAREQFTREQFK